MELDTEPATSWCSERPPRGAGRCATTMPRSLFERLSYHAPREYVGVDRRRRSARRPARGGSQATSSASARAVPSADVEAERRARRCGDAAPGRRYRARRGGVRAVRRLPRRRRPRRDPRARHDRGGDPAARARSAVASSSSTSRPPAGRLQVAAHCGAQTTRDTVALAGSRGGDRRRRGRGDRAAVLPARRPGAARALRRRRGGMRAGSVLRLRVRAGERLRRAARRCWRRCGSARRTSPA